MSSNRTVCYGYAKLDILDSDILDANADFETPFGKQTGCLKIKATAEDDLDQPPLVVEIVIHPTLNVLYFEGAPGVALAEIVEAWN